MKHIISILLLFGFLSGMAQESAIEKSKQLIDDKKYETAYQVLEQADSANQNPDIAIAKTDLVLNYFASSMMHQMFALTDLKADQDIMDVRGKEGMYSMHMFPPDSVLMKLIRKFPDDYRLHKELGYFYHEVYSKYGGRWLIADSLLVNRFKQNYLEAYQHDVVDYWSAYGIGYACILNQDYQDAIPYFEKSIALNPDYPTSHYNLAYAYLYTNQREKGIASAKKALELYRDPQYKADAARMIAVMYREIKQNDQALEYYLQSDRIDPHNYYTLKALLKIELELQKENYKQRTLEFFKLAPTNPTIYQDLIDYYLAAEKTAELLEFFASQHSSYEKDAVIDGNLYFYTALIQFNTNDAAHAKPNFEKARERFAKVFDANHEVFKVIESVTSKME